MAKTTKTSKQARESTVPVTIQWVADQVILTLEGDRATSEYAAASELRVRELGLKAELVPSKLLILQDVPYHVDFQRLASGVRFLREKLLDKGLLTAADFAAAPRFLLVSKWERKTDGETEVPDQDDSASDTMEKMIATLDRKLISSYAASFAPILDQEWPFRRSLPGAHLVIGGTGSGKTTFVIRAGTEVVVRFSERYEAIDARAHQGDGPRTLYALSLPHAVELAAYAGLLGARVALDSLRGLVLKAKGAAGTGGLIPESFLILTDLNNLFVDFDLSVLMTLNPMSLGSEAESANWSEASVAGLIHLTKEPHPGTIHKVAFCATDGRTIDATGDQTGKWSPALAEAYRDKGFIEGANRDRNAAQADRSDGTMFSEDRYSFLTTSGLQGAQPPFSSLAEGDLDGPRQPRASANFSSF